jgi:hypothetical protein
MSKVCLNSADSNVSALVEASKSNFTGFSDNQILAVGSLYFEKYNKLPDASELLDFYAELAVQTKQETFNKEQVTDKEDILDLLQSVFFIGLNRASKGKPLTLEGIKEAQTKVLSKLPLFLEIEGLTNILENYAEYEKLLIKSRLKPLRIEFDGNIESKEFQESKDEGWDRDSTLLSAYQTSTDEVIYLFASLTSNETIKGVSKPLNFKQSWDKTQVLLAGTSDLDTQIKLLRLSDLPFKEQILNKLGYGNFDELAESEYRSIRSSFLQGFAKSAVNFSKSSPGKNTIDSGEEALMQTIQNEWKSKFLASDFAAIVDTKRTTNPDKFEELSELSGEEFLKAYGITVTEWSDSLDVLANKIKQYFFNKEITKGVNHSWLDESKEISSALKDLLRYEAGFRKKDSPLGARNANKEYQHGIMLHSYISKKIGQLKNKLFKPTNMLESLFSEGKAVINIDQGMTSTGQAKSFNKLTKGDLYTSVISDMFSSQPIMHLPRTSDKTSEKGIKLLYTKQLAGKKTIKEYLNQYMAYTEIGPFLYDRLFNQYKSDFIKKSLADIGWTAKGNKKPVEFWNELMGGGNVTPYTKAQFKEGIDKYIDSQVDGLYDDLIKNNVIITNKQGKLETSFSDSFIKPEFSKSKTQQQDIKDFLKLYIFNSLLYGTELTQFTMGSLTTVEPKEFFKRTAGPIAEGRQSRTDESMVNYLDSQRPEYMSEFPSSAFLRIIITAEEEVKSVNAKEYNEVGNTNAYNKVNVDDAQGKMLFENYREYKIMLNEWTDEQEAGYRLLLQNRLNNKKYENLFPPIKPVGYSLVNIKTKDVPEGVDVPIYLKTAIYPIHKNFVKGTLNEDAYDKMIKKGTAIQLPKSGIKLAQPKNLKSQFVDGEFVINEDAIFDFPTADFRSQLDIAVKPGFKQLMGTQQQKLIASNLYKDGEIVNPEFADWAERHTETLQKISDLEMEKLQEKAGIVMVDDVPTFTDYTKLKEMLKDELLNRNLPLNSIEAINEIINEQGQLTATIDAYPSRQKLMNLLNSIVTNKLIKLYTNGSPLVQIAQTGWELKPNSTVDTETSIDFINDEAKKSYIKNNGLQFLQLGEKIGSAEILLPAKFKKFVNEKGEIDSRILLNIGYRIPTQGLNSILHLKVVGFLPIGLDQMVVMPREITTQGGSDFDVDKLNLFVPNLTVDGRYISPEMDSEKEYNDFKNKLDTLLTYIKDGLERKRLVIAEELSIDEFAERLKRDGSIKLTEQEIKDTLEFAGYTPDILTQINKKLEKLDNKEEFIRNFKLKQLQNQIIEQSLEILENKQSAQSLLTPNSAKDLEKLAESLTKDQPKMSFVDMFKPKTLIDITEQMYASKALVGVFASQVTHHVLSQQVGLHFKNFRNFYFKHNEINGNPSLSGTTNQQGQLITDRIGNQYVSGSVDASKNPFLFFLGCTLDTGSVFALFERLGGNVEILVQLMQQPIVKDYLLAVQNNKQLSNKFSKSKSVLTAEIFEKYGYNRSGSEYMTDRYNNNEGKLLMLDALTEQRKDFGNWENHMSKLKTASKNPENLEKATFNKLQKFVLDDFLYLQDAAQIVGESIATSKFDTNGPGKDILQSTLLEENYNKFVQQMNGDGRFTLATTAKDGNYDNLIKDTLLNVFYKKSATFVNKLYKDLVVLNKNENIKSLIKVFNDPDSGFVTKKLDDDSATLVYGSVINYILQRGVGYRNNMFFNNDTVARKVQNVQKDPNHPLHNNYLFTNVFNPEIGDSTTIPDRISVIDKNIDPKETEFIVQAFGNLKAKDLNLYNDLIYVTYFQTGVVTSPVSFYSLIPYNDILPQANDILKQHGEIASNLQDMADAVVANVGYKLNNLKRVSLKPDDGNYGKVLILKTDKTQGKEYILVYDKKSKSQGIFKKVGEGRYELLESKNYKSLFYNLTNEGNVISETDEDVMTDDTPTDVPQITEPTVNTQREYTPENITSLKPNEVFVFGANTAGGHGGGTAGLAQRGTTSSNYTALPIGTKGKWSEYGIVDKLMQGTEGKSFGIVTKAANISGTSLKIGTKRSVPLSRIEESINALIKTANENPSLKFLVTKFGTNMAGFSEQEMKSLLENKNLPDNIILPKEFEVRNELKVTQPQITQRTFKDENLHQAYIKGGLEAVKNFIEQNRKKEINAAKTLSKEVDLLDEFEMLNSKPNKTNFDNDRLIELYVLLKNSKELDFQYSLNELGLNQPQVEIQDNWSNLSLNQMTKLGKLGIKKDNYNSWSTEKQEEFKRCNNI